MNQLPTLTNLTFGQLFLWNGANNDNIRFPRGYMNEFEQFLKTTETLLNFNFGQRFMWIGTHNGHAS